MEGIQHLQGAWRKRVPWMINLACASFRVALNTDICESSSACAIKHVYETWKNRFSTCFGIGFLHYPPIRLRGQNGCNCPTCVCHPSCTCPRIGNFCPLLFLYLACGAQIEAIEAILLWQHGSSDVACFGSIGQLDYGRSLTVFRATAEFKAPSDSRQVQEGAGDGAF